MWKRDETPRPVGTTGTTGTTGNLASTSSESPGTSGAADLVRGVQRTMKQDELVTIGKSIVIKGELSGGEDLTIDGQVEGKVELRDHVLTVGANGRLKAQVFAKSIVVLGQVTGNLSATEKVDIGQNGSVEGDVVAPRVAIADGAHFRGSIDMQRKDGAVTPLRAAAAMKHDGKLSAVAPIKDELAGV